MLIQPFVSPHSMRIYAAPEPRDVNWDRLDLSYLRGIIRTVIVILILILLMVALALPTFFFAGTIIFLPPPLKLPTYQTYIMQ